MLQCSSCGSNLRPTARICIKCGYAVTDEERKKALQQEAASSSSTSIPPLYSSEQSQSIDSEIPDQSNRNEGPVFSSPVGEIISPPVGVQTSNVGAFSSSVASSGITTQQKKIAAIGISAVLVVVFAVGLFSLTGNKDVVVPIVPTATLPSPIPEPSIEQTQIPEPSIEQNVSNALDLKNIRSVMAPAQTSDLLTGMLLNNSNSVKLLELKAKIEENYAKPERGDRKAARALNDQALLSFRQENYQQASNLFADSIKIDPSDIEVLNNYAFALLKGGRYTDSERILGFVLSIAPGRSNGWANLADVYANTNRPDAASAAYVVGFKFARKPDKALAFLKHISESESNENIRRAVTNALAQLSQYSIDTSGIEKAAKSLGD